MHRQSVLLCFFAMLLNSTLSWSSEWVVAPAKASDDIEDGLNAPYQSIEGIKNLEELLTGIEGWLWLKTTLSTTHKAYVFNMGVLPWVGWKNENRIGSDGIGPPRWQPSSSRPFTITHADTNFPETIVYFKIFVRSGYGEIPPVPLGGSIEKVQLLQIILSLINLGIPFMVLIVGLLLFLVGLMTLSRGQKGWLIAAAFFGGAMFLAYVEKLLTFVPNLTVYLPWSIFTYTTTIFLPLALTLWRRSITGLGFAQLKMFSILDWIFFVCVVTWRIYSLDASNIPDYLPRVLTNDPFFYYLLFSLALIYVQWMRDAAMQYTIKGDALFIFLAGIIPSIALLIWIYPLNAFDTAFIQLGLPTALAITCILFIAYQKRSKSSALRRIKEPLISSKLAENLHEALFPESIPLNPQWDIAGKYWGSANSSVGFYDVHSKGNTQIGGFIYTHCSGDILPSLTYAHLIRGEMIRLNETDLPLSQRIRAVHQRSASVAQTAGCLMYGVMGYLETDRIAIVPFSSGPVLLRRQGRVHIIRSFKGDSADILLGSNNFGSKRLRTIGIPMKSGDVCILFPPNFTEIETAAQLLKNRGRTAQEIVATISNALKNPAEARHTNQYFQILGIRRK